MPKIRIRRAHTYEIDFKCDICGSGYYRPIGIILPTYEYIHRCTVCGAEMVVAAKKYPYTVAGKRTE